MVSSYESAKWRPTQTEKPRRLPPGLGAARQATPMCLVRALGEAALRDPSCL